MHCPVVFQKTSKTGGIAEMTNTSRYTEARNERVGAAG